MKHSFIKQFICSGVALAPVFLFTGCVDNSYGDLDDIDLTMGLGSDGLGVKLGNTEKIMLEDILSVDESVKLDGNNLYYLVESGNTDFEVNITPLTVNLDIPALEMKMNVLSYDNVKSQFEDFTGIPVPEGLPIPIKKGSDFIPTGLADSKETESKFTVAGISSDVRHINWVSFTSTEVALKLHEKKSPNVKFGIDGVRNMVITLPKELRVTNYPSDIWTYDAKNHTLTQDRDKPLKMQNGDLTICKVTVDRADVNTAVDGDEITINSDITMKGDVDFFVTEDFEMGSGDYMDVELEFEHGDRLNIEEVNGRFNPEVKPDPTTIDIAESLPDFLQDEGVRVSVSNPTLKFTAQLEQIPIGFNFGAKLTSVKKGEGGFSNLVTLPQVTIENNKNSLVYYHQGDAPYDPEVAEIPAGAVTERVNNLSTLIERLPDYISVDLGGKQIEVLDKDFTIRMGKTYTASAAYDIYVPFEFDKGLAIVYKDSTNSIGEDLEDYAAHGLRVSAKVQNTIPLGLKLSVVAHDANNRPVPGITFTQASVKPGTGDVNRPVESELVIDGDLSDPYLLGKIDHFVFDITADASQNGEEVRRLLSTQYVRLADIRVRLKGQVIANFN